MTIPPNDPGARPGRETRGERGYVYRGEGTSWYQAWLWNFGKVLSRLIAVVFFRFHASGTHHIPRKGPALLVSNHQSFLDPWLIGVAPPRQIHYMARDTLFKRGGFGWLIETLNAFPVKRGTGDRNTIRLAAERLDKGYVVNIFPEGTRSEDGTIGPIAPGMALILRMCKVPVPIVPVVIDGAFEAWPRHRKLPGPKPIRIMHGTPIPAEELAKMSAEELAVRVRTELVKLQERMGSKHAEASRKRVEAEGAAAASPRRRRGETGPRGEAEGQSGEASGR